MAAAEAEAAFGDATMYVEKALVPARHVEIQVLCDQHGNVLTLGERECSIQRRHQKLIEESPSAALSPEAREAMELAAERACRAVGYRNAGTFEFLLGPDGSFYFIELNARLQVEHPVTELCTGIDLVREQLLVAAGEELSVTGRAPRRGHAIEIRLNAEDPGARFPSLARAHRSLRAAARAGRPGRHVRRVGIGDLAVLRLDGRQADRLGQRPACRDRARGARAARDDHRGRADDARSRARGARERAVPKRRVLDVDARGAPRTGRMTISRRQARRQALFLLYQWDLSGQEIGSQYAGEIDPWARGVAEAVAGQAPELDLRITSASDGWTADRLGVVERSALRVAVHELTTGEVPAEVAINEAVAFTKRYASDDGARLVNGILGRIQREEVA